MKVKELIEKLQEFNPEHNLLIGVNANDFIIAEITEIICQDRWDVWVHVDIIE